MAADIPMRELVFVMRYVAVIAESRRPYAGAVMRDMDMTGYGKSAGEWAYSPAVGNHVARPSLTKKADHRSGR